MAACCQGGVCSMPPPTPVSSSSSSSSSALSAGPRIGIPHGLDANPDAFEFLDAHAENILHFDGPTSESVTLRLQQLNGHKAAKLLLQTDPLAIASPPLFSSAKRSRPWNRVMAIHALYADDSQRVEPVHLKSLQQMNPPVSQALIDAQVRDSLSPAVIRHRTAHIVRGGVDQTGLFDLVYEWRIHSNWAAKVYGIGHANQKAMHQLVGGVNIRYDSPRTCCIVKYSTDGQTVGGSVSRALGRLGETVFGAEGFWVHDKLDYTFGMGIRRRWSGERFRRPLVFSSWFQSYGMLNAAVSAPLTDSIQLATNFNYEVASQQSNVQIATQYTPTAKTLSAFGLPENMSASLHAKFDYDRGVSAAVRLNSRLTKYGSLNGSLGVSSAIKRNAVQTPTSIAIAFELY